MSPYLYIVLPSYAVLAFIGGVLALFFLYVRLERYSVDFLTFLKLFGWCVLGGFIGSKVIFAVSRIPWLIENFTWKNLLLLIPQSGFVFYGGLFGVICAMLWYTQKDMELRKNVFALAVPAMPLFHMFGRIGCFLAGCCYGKLLAAPVTVLGLVTFDRIPVQLIEAVFEGILFLVLAGIQKKRADTDLLRIYLIVYAVFRFIMEFFRGDAVRGFFFGLSTAQWISIIIVVVYALRLVRKVTVKENDDSIMDKNLT